MKCAIKREQLLLMSLLLPVFIGQIRASDAELIAGLSAGSSNEEPTKRAGFFGMNPQVQTAAGARPFFPAQAQGQPYGATSQTMPQALSQMSQPSQMQQYGMTGAQQPMQQSGQQSGMNGVQTWPSSWNQTSAGVMAQNGNSSSSWGINPQGQMYSGQAVNGMSSGMRPMYPAQAQGQTQGQSYSAQSYPSMSQTPSQMSQPSQMQQYGMTGSQQPMQQSGMNGVQTWTSSWNQTSNQTSAGVMAQNGNNAARPSKWGSSQQMQSSNGMSGMSSMSGMRPGYPMQQTQGQVYPAQSYPSMSQTMPQTTSQMSQASQTQQYGITGMQQPMQQSGQQSGMNGVQTWSSSSNQTSAGVMAQNGSSMGGKWGSSQQMQSSNGMSGMSGMSGMRPGYPMQQTQGQAYPAQSYPSMSQSMPQTTSQMQQYGMAGTQQPMQQPMQNTWDQSSMGAMAQNWSNTGTWSNGKNTWQGYPNQFGQKANYMQHGAKDFASKQRIARFAKKAGGLVGFGVGVGLVGNANKVMAVQKDGKIIAVARNHNRCYFNGSVARYHADGKLDILFENPKLESTMPGYHARSAVVTHDQQVIVAYTNNDSFELVRYKSDGSIDHNFEFSMPGRSAASKLNAMALQPDGKILVGTNSPEMPLMRFMSNGAFDTSFRPDNSTANLSGVTAIAISSSKMHGKDGAKGANKVYDKHMFSPKNKQMEKEYSKANGKHMIVVAGYTNSSMGGQSAKNATLVRFDMNGTVDQWFQFSGVPAGTQNARFKSLAIQPNAGIIVAGSSTNAGPLLMRVSPTGLVDQSFNAAVESSTPHQVMPGGNDRYNSVAINPKNNNDIIAVGKVNGQFVLRRYNAAGGADVAHFGDRGTVGLYDGEGHSVAFTPNGEVVTGGQLNIDSASMPVFYKI